MRRLTAMVCGAAVAGTLILALPASAGRAPAAGHGDLSEMASLIARQALPAGDGWGAAGDGTTGGAEAAS
ncbi:MAG TPA: hypothetical protein VFZ85_03690, partial [Jiangellaceae bacterium]